MFIDFFVSLVVYLFVCFCLFGSPIPLSAMYLVTPIYFNCIIVLLDWLLDIYCLI